MNKATQFTWFQWILGSAVAAIAVWIALTRVDPSTPGHLAADPAYKSLCQQLADLDQQVHTARERRRQTTEETTASRLSNEIQALANRKLKVIRVFNSQQTTPYRQGVCQA